jgi:hypothetical protein
MCIHLNLSRMIFKNAHMLGLDETRRMARLTPN